MTFFLIFPSAIVFIFYGLMILLTNHMRLEFERYGLTRFRTLTGMLEICGGVGLLTGIYIPIILTLSSLGLALLMILGIVVRIRVKDTFLNILPAVVLMIVNSYIFLSRLGAV